MKPFAILVEANSDVPEQFAKDYNLDVIPGHLSLPDKSERTIYTRWEGWTREEFYKDLKKNPDGYQTAPASVGEMKEAMVRHIKNGEDILVITISAAISGAYGFTLQAKELALQECPDANINVVDSLRFGPGFALISVYAAMLRNEGKDLAEVTAWVEEHKSHFHQAGWLDDLSFVAKKGRLTHAKAFFGQLAGVKPIGEFDYNGLTTIIGKAAGAKAAYAALMQYIEATIEKPEEQIIFIAQTNRLAFAEEYKKMIEEKFHPKAVYITDVYPLCGVNVGPGLMAAYYQGKEISKDLSVERAIIEKALAK